MNSTEETGTDVTVTLLSCFSRCQVLNGVTLTIECTIECSAAVITDVHAPVDTCEVNVSCEVYSNTSKVITSVYSITECNELLYIINIVSIGVVYDSVVAISISLTEYITSSDESSSSVLLSSSRECTASDSTSKLGSVRAANLTIECTIGYCKSNVICAVSYKYRWAIVATRSECTTIDFQVRGVINSLYPKLTLEVTAIDSHLTLPQTCRTIVGSRDCTAIDSRLTAVLEDSAVHVCSLLTEVLDGTVLNYESTLVTYGVWAPTVVRITSTSILEADLTLTSDGQVTLIENHVVVACASLLLTDGLTIEVKSDSLISRNGYCLCKSNVVKNFHLSASSECIGKWSVVLITNLSNTHCCIVGVVRLSHSSTSTYVEYHCIATIEGITCSRYWRSLVLEYPDTSAIVNIIVRIQAGESSILNDNSVISTMSVDYVSTLVWTTVNSYCVTSTITWYVHCVCPVTSWSISEVYRRIVQCQLNILQACIDRDTADISCITASLSIHHIHIVQCNFDVACCQAEYARSRRCHLMVVTIDGHWLANHDNFRSLKVCKECHSLTSLNCSPCLSKVVEINIIYAYNSILDQSVNNFTLNILCTCNIYSSKSTAFAGEVSSLVCRKLQCTIVLDIGIRAELIVDVYGFLATLNLTVLQAKSCAVVTLNPKLDTSYTTRDRAVGCSSARSRDEHTSTLSGDSNVLHSTDYILCSIATVVCLDTVGESSTLDGYVLDRTYLSGRTALEHDTANSLVSIALTLNVDYEVFECSSIPYLDSSSVACVNNVTVLHSRIALDAHTAPCIACGKSLTAEVKSDSLSDGKLICTVVDVSSHYDSLDISICKCSVEFSLCCNFCSSSNRSINTISVNNLVTISRFNFKASRSSKNRTATKFEGSRNYCWFCNSHCTTNRVSVTCHFSIKVLNLGCTKKLNIILRTRNDNKAARAIAPCHVSTINSYILNNELSCIAVEHPTNRSTFSHVDCTILKDNVCCYLGTNLEAWSICSLRACTRCDGVSMTIKVEYHIILHKAQACSSNILKKSDCSTFKSWAVCCIRNSLEHVVIVLNLSFSVNRVTCRICYLNSIWLYLICITIVNHLVASNISSNGQSFRNGWRIKVKYCTSLECDCTLKLEFIKTTNFNLLACRDNYRFCMNVIRSQCDVVTTTNSIDDILQLTICASTIYIARSLVSNLCTIYCNVAIGYVIGVLEQNLSISHCHICVGKRNSCAWSLQFNLESLSEITFCEADILVKVTVTSKRTLSNGTVSIAYSADCRCIRTPTSDITVLEWHVTTSLAVEMYGKVAACKSTVLDCDVTSSITVSHSVVTREVYTIKYNVLTVYIKCTSIIARCIIMYIQILYSSTCINTYITCNINKVVTFSVSSTLNSDSLVHVNVCSVITCEDGYSLTSLSSLDCVSNSSIAIITNLGYKCHRSKNGLIANLNSDVIVSVCRVTLLIVPEWVAWNVTCTEASCSGLTIDSQVNTTSKAWIHFDSCLTLNCLWSVESTLGYSNVVGNRSALSIDKNWLTCTVEGTLVECNFLSTVCPNVVIITSVHKCTVVEGLALAIEEYLTIEGTVVVNQVARVLQALVWAVRSVCECNVVECHICTATTKCTDVCKLNAVNSTSDGNVVLYLESICASLEDNNLIACLSSCHSGIEWSRKRLDYTVSIGSSRYDRIKVVGTVELDSTLSYLNTVNPLLYAVRLHCYGRSNSPRHCPIIVCIWSGIKLDVPSYINVTINNVINIVQWCRTHKGFATEELELEGVVSVTTTFTPVTISCSISSREWTLLMVTIQTILWQVRVYNNLNLTSSSCRHCAVGLILRSTDSHPETICVSSSKFVSTLNFNIAFSICFAYYNRDERRNSVALNYCIVVVGVGIETDTVTVNSDFTFLYSNTLNGTKCKTALRVCYSHVLNGEVPTCSVLEEWVEASTCTILDNYAVWWLQADSYTISSLLIRTSEWATLNSQARIVVGSSRGDEVTTFVSYEVDTLDSDTTVVVSIWQRRDGDSTIHLLTVTINGVVETNLLGESYVLGDVRKECDSLTVLNCIDSILERGILCNANLSYREFNLYSILTNYLTCCVDWQLSVCTIFETTSCNNLTTICQSYGRVTSSFCVVLVNSNFQGRVVENEVSWTLTIGLVSLPIGTSFDVGILGIDHTLIEVCYSKVKTYSLVIVITYNIDTSIGVAIHVTDNASLSCNSHATGLVDGELSACIALIVSTSNNSTIDLWTTCIVEECGNIQSDVLTQHEGVGAIYPIRVGECNGYLSFILCGDITTKSCCEVLCNILTNNNSLIVVCYSRESSAQGSILYTINLSYHLLSNCTISIHLVTLCNTLLIRVWSKCTTDNLTVLVGYNINTCVWRPSFDYTAMVFDVINSKCVSVYSICTCSVNGCVYCVCTRNLNPDVVSATNELVRIGIYAVCVSASGVLAKYDTVIVWIDFVVLDFKLCTISNCHKLDSISICEIAIAWTLDNITSDCSLCDSSPTKDCVRTARGYCNITVLNSECKCLLLAATQRDECASWVGVSGVARSNSCSYTRNGKSLSCTWIDPRITSEGKTLYSKSICTVSIDTYVIQGYWTANGEVLSNINSNVSNICNNNNLSTSLSSLNSSSESCVTLLANLCDWNECLATTDFCLYTINLHRTSACSSDVLSIQSRTLVQVKSLTWIYNKVIDINGRVCSCNICCHLGVTFLDGKCRVVDLHITKLVWCATWEIAQATANLITIDSNGRVCESSWVPRRCCRSKSSVNLHIWILNGQFTLCVEVLNVEVGIVHLDATIVADRDIAVLIAVTQEIDIRLLGSALSTHNQFILDVDVWHWSARWTSTCECTARLHGHRIGHIPLRSRITHRCTVLDENRKSRVVLVVVVKRVSTQSVCLLNYDGRACLTICRSIGISTSIIRKLGSSVAFCAAVVIAVYQQLLCRKRETPQHRH